MSSYFEKITDPVLLQSYLILSLMSFLLSFIIIRTAHYFFIGRGEEDQFAVQSAHKGFVPRVGGLAIYVSILIFLVFPSLGLLSLSFMTGLSVGNLTWLMLTVSPLFVVGLLEDLGFNMSPGRRVLASAFSGLLAIIFFQTWVSRVGIVGLDWFLAYGPFGILFTVFATTGVVNAFNLIDGLNGLVSYTSMSIAIALSLIAFHTNNTEMLRFLFIISACIMGFLVLNFPFGKIFLGDAGAYTLGYLLVWCAILIVNSQMEISPFAILLIFFWPIADTLLSIWRRWNLSKPAGQPDRLHFHQLVMRFLEIRILGRDKRNIANPLATTILIPLISTPQVLGVVFWNNFPATVWATLFVGLLFVGTYTLIINIAKTS